MTDIRQTWVNLTGFRESTENHNRVESSVIIYLLFPKEEQLTMLFLQLKHIVLRDKSQAKKQRVFSYCPTQGDVGSSEEYRGQDQTDEGNICIGSTHIHIGVCMLETRR